MLFFFVYEVVFVVLLWCCFVCGLVSFKGGIFRVFGGWLSVSYC